MYKFQPETATDFVNIKKIINSISKNMQSYQMEK